LVEKTRKLVLVLVISLMGSEPSGFKGSWAVSGVTPRLFEFNTSVEDFE